MRSRWHSSFLHASKQPPAMTMLSGPARQWSTLRVVFRRKINRIEGEGNLMESVSKSAREYRRCIMIRA